MDMHEKDNHLAEYASKIISGKGDAGHRVELMRHLCGVIGIDSYDTDPHSIKGQVMCFIAQTSEMRRSIGDEPMQCCDVAKDMRVDEQEFMAKWHGMYVTCCHEVRRLVGIAMAMAHKVEHERIERTT